MAIDVAVVVVMMNVVIVMTRTMVTTVLLLINKDSPFISIFSSLLDILFSGFPDDRSRANSKTLEPRTSIVV